jgi:hypothetical protein
MASYTVRDARKGSIKEARRNQIRWAWRFKCPPPVFLRKAAIVNKYTKQLDHHPARKEQTAAVPLLSARLLTGRAVHQKRLGTSRGIVVILEKFLNDAE